MKTYTRKEIVERIPSLTHRQIQFYTEEGVVKPVETKTGRGNARIYSEENLKEFAIIGHLAQLGMTVGTIHKVIESKPFSLERFPEYVRKGLLFDYSLVILFQGGDLLYAIPLQSPQIEDLSMEEADDLRYSNRFFRTKDKITTALILAADAGKIKMPCDYDVLIYIDLTEIIRKI